MQNDNVLVNKDHFAIHLWYLETILENHFYYQLAENQLRYLWRYKLEQKVSNIFQVFFYQSAFRVHRPDKNNKNTETPIDANLHNWLQNLGSLPKNKDTLWLLSSKNNTF